jgi:hypothetical protein
MSEFNLLVWYWIPSGNTTQAWSSASQSYVALTDATYEAWLAAGNSPTHIATTDLPAIQAQVAMASGIAITSAGTPGLDAVYDVSQAAQQNIASVIDYIEVNATFPGPSETLAWSDMTAGFHTFNDVPTFKAFATSVANFAAAVIIYGDSKGEVGSIPTPSASII